MTGRGPPPHGASLAVHLLFLVSMWADVPDSELEEQINFRLPHDRHPGLRAGSCSAYLALVHLLQANGLLDSISHARLAKICPRHAAAITDYWARNA